MPDEDNGMLSKSLAIAMNQMSVHLAAENQVSLRLYFVRFTWLKMTAKLC